MDKYQPLRDANTNGANYDLDADQIIAQLQTWDGKYGVTLSDVTHDAVTVTFNAIPVDDVPALAAEIYEFCPDTIDQHFGCFAEMMEMADETGEELPPELLELTAGVDFEDDQYGLELLQRSLAKHRHVALWWD
jgi:hypothetical protein